MNIPGMKHAKQSGLVVGALHNIIDTLKFEVKLFGNVSAERALEIIGYAEDALKRQAEIKESTSESKASALITKFLS